MLKFRTASLLGFFILSTFSCEDKPVGIKINDHTFLQALIEQGVDSNSDGLISPAEAQAISKLELNGKGIIDMTGIEAFINLDSLYCETNRFTWINLSECKKLRVLYCSHGRLKTLDVSSNPLLEALACERNVDLRVLNVTNHPHLYYLNCQYCGLTSLDIRGAISLEILMSETNRITHIDFSTNPKLRWLFFAFCDLESVELSGLAELEWAYFQGNQLQNASLGSHPILEELGLGINQLTEVDLSGCPALKILGLSANELTSLDISRNTLISTLNLSDMPTLETVCVWETPFPPVGVNLNTEGSLNVNYSTNCQ